MWSRSISSSPQLFATSPPNTCLPSFPRLNGQKKYDEAAELMTTGALQLLNAGQVNSGAELAGLLLETYAQAGTHPDAAPIDTLQRLFVAFPTDATGADKAMAFLRAAIKWSGKAGGSPLGNSSLHLTAARHHWQVGRDFLNAQKHFVKACTHAEENVALLQEWSQTVYDHERDLLLTRVVLLYLCCENLDGANIVFAKCRESMDTPLINFCQFCTQYSIGVTLQLFLII
jgi:hypothetical protein